MLCIVGTAVELSEATATPLSAQVPELEETKGNLNSQVAMMARVYLLRAFLAPNKVA